MKVCNICGFENDGKDGENVCETCQRSAKKRAQRKASRKAREDVLRSCGLVKVHGAMGGTYWE